MEPEITRPKGILIAGWVVSVVTFIVTAPIAFIAGVFSSDNVSGQTYLISYALIAAPIIFLIFPVIAQVAYRRGHFSMAKTFSIGAIAVCVVAIATLAIAVLR
jgi:hypothetical protein